MPPARIAGRCRSRRSSGGADRRGRPPPSGRARRRRRRTRWRSRAWASRASGGGLIARSAGRRGRRRLRVPRPRSRPPLGARSAEGRPRRAALRVQGAHRRGDGARVAAVGAEADRVAVDESERRRRLAAGPVRSGGRAPVDAGHGRDAVGRRRDVEADGTSQALHAQVGVAVGGQPAEPDGVVAGRLRAQPRSERRGEEGRLLAVGHPGQHARRRGPAADGAGDLLVELEPRTLARLSVLRPTGNDERRGRRSRPARRRAGRPAPRRRATARTRRSPSARRPPRPRARTGPGAAGLPGPAPAGPAYAAAAFRAGRG